MLNDPAGAYRSLKETIFDVAFGGIVFDCTEDLIEYPQIEKFNYHHHWKFTLLWLDVSHLKHSQVQIKPEGYKPLGRWEVTLFTWEEKRAFFLEDKLVHFSLHYLRDEQIVFWTDRVHCMSKNTNQNISVTNIPYSSNQIHDLEIEIEREFGTLDRENLISQFRSSSLSAVEDGILVSHGISARECRPLWPFSSQIQIPPLRFAGKKVLSQLLPAP